MTSKRTTAHAKGEADSRVDVIDAVSTQHQATQDNGQLLGHCKELNHFQERAAAIPSSSFMQKKLNAAWTLGRLGLVLLVIVIPVVKGGTVNASREPHTATIDAASWIKQLPQDVVSRLDTQVDPCNDLYAFSCGSWQKQTVIPDDESGVDLYYSTVSDDVYNVLKEVMQQGWPLVSDLYDSCMNFSNTTSTAADAASVAFLSPTLKQIAAATSKSEVFQLAGMLLRAGTSFLTGIDISADAIQTTTYAFSVLPKGLSLPDPQYYLDQAQFDSIRVDFHTYIADFFSLVGWDSKEAASQASTVIAFEQTLAPLFVPQEEQAQDSDNRMSVTQAAQKYPLLFAHFMNGTGTLENLIAQNASVIVTETAFFERVEELVTGPSVTLDTLKAMLTYQYISAQAKFLSESFYRVYYVFTGAKLLDQKRRAPRWKVCLERVFESFPDLAGKYFALNRFDKTSERFARELVEQIQASFKEILMHEDWLDEHTRQGALEKLGGMGSLIGVSNESYQFPFELHGDAPLAENVRIITEHEFERSVARIGRRVDRNEWGKSGAEVSGFYQPWTNQIILPAGILQPPFFSREQHPARNFGAISTLR